MHFLQLHTTQQPPPVIILHLGFVLPLLISRSELTLWHVLHSLGIKTPKWFLVSLYKLYWSVQLEALMSPSQWLILYILPKYLSIIWASEAKPLSSGWCETGSHGTSKQDTVRRNRMVPWYVGPTCMWPVSRWTPVPRFKSACQNREVRYC